MYNQFCLCALDDSGMNCTELCLCRILQGVVEEGGRKALSTSNLHNHKLATEIMDTLPAFAAVKVFEGLGFRLTILL